MIYSMTGFGKAEGMVGEMRLNVQMRSLNSKSLDLNLRVPSLFRELEGEIRKLVGDSLYRGKVEINVSIQSESSTNSPNLNQEVFKKYYQDIKALSEELGLELKDPIGTISKFPEIFSSQEEELSESEKDQFLAVLKKAIDELNQFRIEEGKTTEADLKSQIAQIETQLDAALQYEEERVSGIRNRINQKLDEYLDKSQINQDRFEQELIFYMEKFDISEEKVRLRSHCQYFNQVLDEEEKQGKKLNFISQEIGREINTLGSKANHAEMQKQVVLMKESLEKIKEQLLNIL